jgi:FkbM family methyltransferase
LALSLEDRLKLLFVPGAIYYPRKLRSEQAKGEPEIRILPKLFGNRDGMAIDVGANRGIFSFLLAGMFKRVVAFEPNPDLAAFAERMLPGNVEVRRIALGAATAPGQLRIPVDKHGREAHLIATLAKSISAPLARTVEVDVTTLDNVETESVRFIKIDVEGTEMDVIEGARATIARDRPILLVELLAGFYEDPLALVRQVCVEHDYLAQVFAEGCMTDAVAHLQSGQPTPSRNVLFLPTN